MSELRLVSPEEEGKDTISPALAMPKCMYAQTFLVDSPLFFGAAERFTEEILQGQDVRVLALAMTAVNHMDLTGVETLLSVHRQLERKGARVVLAPCPRNLWISLKRTKAINEIGEQVLFRDLSPATIDCHVNLLTSTCSDCALVLDPTQKPAGPRDCKMRAALRSDNSPLIKLVKDRVLCKEGVAPPAVAHVEGRLIPRSD
jgi:anti-anti-sigma regulatory factor